MKGTPRQRDRDRLDETAASLLSFLAADPERFERFLSLTGLHVGDLPATARRPGFAESLLGYLASDERLLLAYAEAEGRDPAEIAALALAATSPPDPD